MVRWAISCLGILESAISLAVMCLPAFSADADAARRFCCHRADVDWSHLDLTLDWSFRCSLEGGRKGGAMPVDAVSIAVFLLGGGSD